MNKKVAKILASIIPIPLVLTIALSTSLVNAAAGKVTRTSGIDRYATAAQVAKSNWTTSDNIVLVSGEGYADAVSATALAKKLNAPILLTTATSLSLDAANALNSLKVKNIYVIGGNASISRGIRDQLKEDYTLIELGGNNRYETNISVAEKLIELGVNSNNIMMVGGEGFADALSVAPIAAAKEQILLLGMNDADYIKPVLDFISKRQSKVTVVGTKYVITDTILNSFNGTRVDGGQDRFNTNLKVLSTFKDTLKTDKLYVANASEDGYADALVASALAGKYTAPLVLADTEGSPATSSAVNYIKNNAEITTDLNVIGGNGVVSDSTINAINEAVNPDFSGNITSVDTLHNQNVNIKLNDQMLPFTINGGKSVSLEDILNAGYSIRFVTDSPVFVYDSNTSKSQTSIDGALDKTALTNFYYGSATSTATVVNDHFNYQIQIYKNNLLVALSSFTTVHIINGDTTANKLTDYTIKLLGKNSDGSYINISTGDRTAAIKNSNLATKITSGKLVKGEQASVNEVKGSLVNGQTNVDITNVKFYSSNSFIASVDENSGIITANSNGDFTLTIKSGNQIKNISISVVNGGRKVSSATSNISSIKLGKGSSTGFYLTLIDQYGDAIQGNAIAPAVSTDSVNNGTTTKDTDYQIQYVKNSNGDAIAYEKVISQANTEGTANIYVLNDGNTPNIGDGILKIVNNSGAVILTFPVSVNLSVLIDTTKFEPIRDGKSEALTLDLNPQAASDYNHEYVKINLNKYAVDGTSLGTVNSFSNDFAKYKFYITQDVNNKIIDDSAAVNKTLIPVTMNPNGCIILSTPYGAIDQEFNESVTSTITPSNNIKDNKNVIDVAHTGTLTLIAKSYDPITNTEGQIKSSINISVQDSSPNISSALLRSNMEASIPSTSTGGDIVIFNIKDILKESNISITNSAGDGKIRIANNGSIFINYKDGLEGSVNNIQNGDPSYDSSADILLGYIVSSANDSSIAYTTVNTDGTISAKLSEGKTSGKFTIGVLRLHERTPFTTTMATINKN